MAESAIAKCCPTKQLIRIEIMFVVSCPPLGLVQLTARLARVLLPLSTGKGGGEGFMVSAGTPCTPTLST